MKTAKVYTKNTSWKTSVNGELSDKEIKGVTVCECSYLATI